MKINLFSLLIILHLLNPFFGTTAGAVVFPDLYVFGDSLSDNGQLPDIFAGHPNLRATNRTDPLDPNSETAMVWPQYFSQGLSLGKLLPSDPWVGPSGNNYAVVGYMSEDIKASITDRFLIREPKISAQALYVVWGGGNDLLDIRRSRATSSENEALISESRQAADTIVAGAQALWRAGGRYILIPNLPNIGDVPESFFLGSSYIAAGDVATLAFNDRLLSRLNNTGINVIQADVCSLFDEMLNMPTLFGFSNENHRFLAFDGNSFTGVLAMEGVNGITTSTPDPSKYIFYDGIHPTTFAANIISQYYLSILTAPGQISILAEVPLYLAGNYMDAVGDHLKQVQSSMKKGEIIPFVSGGYNHVGRDGTGYIPGYDSPQYDLTAGLSYVVSDVWFIGTAVGHHTGKIDIDNDTGEFDIDTRFLSLLTGYRHKKLAINAIVSIADLDYTDISRKLRLGQLLRTETGETSGDYQALKLFASIDFFNRNGFIFGPLSSLNYQNITVNAYEELGNRSTCMNFQDQSRQSVLARMGFFASHEMDTVLGLLKMGGDFGYEKELRDGDRSLRAGLINLPGSSFEIPLSHPEKSFWPFHFSMGVQFATNWEFRLLYQLTLGNETVRAQGAQVSILARF